jgi:hypothetical protein
VKRSPALALVLAGLLLAGCTLERRADPDASLRADSDLVPDEGVLDPQPVPADPAESVRVTLEVFREAIRVGDISLALQLLDAQAMLLDDLALDLGNGASELPPTRGELLLALRRRHAEGLGLQVLDTELRWVDETAVLSTRLLLLHRGAGSDAEPDSVGLARESAVLRPTPEGWRILHFHRSVVPGS